MMFTVRKQKDVMLKRKDICSGQNSFQWWRTCTRCAANTVLILNVINQVLMSIMQTHCLHFFVILYLWTFLWHGYKQLIYTNSFLVDFFFLLKWMSTTELLLLPRLQTSFLIPIWSIFIPFPVSKCLRKRDSAAEICRVSRKTLL